MPSPQEYFPFYLYEFVSSPLVRKMSRENPLARAVFLDAWLVQWMEGSLPKDADAVRDLLGLSNEDWIYCKFYLYLEDAFPVDTDCKRRNMRLEQIRSGVSGEVDKKREAGRIGGLKSAQKRAFQVQNPSTGQGTSSTPQAPLDVPQAIKLNEMKGNEIKLNTGDPPISPKGEILVFGAPSLAKASAEDFSQFWAAYPRKVGKPKALVAWSRAVAKRNVTPEEILLGVGRYVAYIAEVQKDSEHVAHPTTWLNRDGWQDQYAATGKPGVMSTYQDLCSRLDHIPDEVFMESCRA